MKRNKILLLQHHGGICHYAERKLFISKDVDQDSIYRTCSRENCGDRKHMNGCQELGVGGLLQSGSMRSFCDDKRVLSSDRGGGGGSINLYTD